MLEIWLLLLPLLSSIICGLVLLNCNKRYSEVLATVTMFITAGIAWVIFINLFFGNTAPYILKICDFIKINNFTSSWAIKIDRLTSLMLIIITTVSAVVHCYSIGYMGSDKALAKFMSYISLFTFFMILLVVSSNLLQLFVGWEGVGLSSYLLIGFWYRKDSANLAAKKAFIVNRVGDLFLLVGIIAIYYSFGSLDFSVIIDNIGQVAINQINIFGCKLNILEFIGILLFLGAMGKSAQIGLHVWLPDAMEGPTPVSALIHAATMVTAGIFLIARLSFIYDQTIIARELITYIGAITALFAATVAIVQTDIKKIIAYSTCSQLGYMFFACGVGAYNAGMFHLVTHAFFKAVLFLSAGSVIHGLNGEQNIFKMGKIYNKMPISFLYFLISTIAISGFYPFSGFYSKDAILESAFASQTSFGNIAYIIGVFVAFLTSFYSWRLIIVVFGSSKNYSNNIIPHESPKIMLLPILILVIGTIFSGIILYKKGVIDTNSKFWQDSLSVSIINNQYLDIHALPFLIKYLPLFVSALGLIFAYIAYGVLNKECLSYYQNKWQKLYNFFYNKWYFDELYRAILVNNLKILAEFINKIIEKIAIDGCGPMGAAKILNLVSKRLKIAQSGYIYHYALSLFAGMVIILSWFIWFKLY